MSRCRACNRMIDIYDKNAVLEFPSDSEILEALYDLDEETLEESFNKEPNSVREEEDLCSHCRVEVINSVRYSREYEHEDVVNDPLREIFNN